MRITLAAVGRFPRRAGMASPEAALYESYARRIVPPLALREVAVAGRLRPAELNRREGEMLLAALPAGAMVVALDRSGRTMDSTALARALGRWRDRGVRELAFVIGGAEGLDPALTKRADMVLSLGPMTWPHLLVRGMLAEQIYRAQCILGRHPYHRS